MIAADLKRARCKAPKQVGGARLRFGHGTGAQPVPVPGCKDSVTADFWLPPSFPGQGGCTARWN